MLCKWKKPSTVASYALRTETQNLPKDFYENYIKNINAVTPEDVRNAAKKYFSVDNARIIVVGKAADVLPGLESRNMPIFYFDKWGNKTEKPVLNKPIPEGVTAKSVLNDYIKAIGGEKGVKGVKTMAVQASGTIQGTELEVNTKYSSDHKMAMEMKAMGMTMMKQVVNNKEGYVIRQGQKIPITGEELESMRESAVPFEELDLLNNAEVELTSIESINGADAYAVKNGDTTLYYDTKTGYKVAQSVEAEQMGKTMTQTTYYSNYKEAKGIKVPYKITINMGVDIELSVSDVKINEGVTDADFQ